MQKTKKIDFSDKDPVNLRQWILMGCTAVGITAAGIFWHQNFFRILPLYISLMVGLLQSHANRYANLLGSINCILYTIVYVYFGLYASAATTILVSCPVQMATFICWSKKAWKHSTLFRKLTAARRLWIGIGFVGLYTVIMLILISVDSSYRVLDTLVSLTGLLSSVLAILSYIEYSWVMVGTCVLNIILFINMLAEYPEQMTYLLYSVYSLICIIQQFFTVRRLYAIQQKESKAAEKKKTA